LLQLVLSLVFTALFVEVLGVSEVIGPALGGSHASIQRSFDAGLLDLAANAPHARALLLRRGVVRGDAATMERFQQALLALVEQYITLDAESAGDADVFEVLLAVFPTLTPRETAQAAPLD
jgi:hypothetical protein